MHTLEIIVHREIAVGLGNVACTYDKPERKTLEAMRIYIDKLQSDSIHVRFWVTV